MKKSVKVGKTTSWKMDVAVWINNKVFPRLGINGILISTMLHKKRKKFVYESADYVRLSSLELVAEVIYENKIGGSVAELGVFRGDFARYINLAFPDRKLYLFDTFEGFSEKDIMVEEEIRGGEVTGLHDFSSIDIDIVLNKMKYRENCIVKKGYFPETASDVDDTFAFVSIDTDLFEPIYNGLVFFYPRLKQGGYIFVHDVVDFPLYSGAKLAVKKFCQENDVSYFPLSDICGTAVIIKPAI